MPAVQATRLVRHQVLTGCIQPLGHRPPPPPPPTPPCSNRMNCQRVPAAPGKIMSASAEVRLVRSPKLTPTRNHSGPSRRAVPGTTSREAHRSPGFRTSPRSRVLGRCPPSVQDHPGGPAGRGIRAVLTGRRVSAGRWGPHRPPRSRRSDPPRRRSRPGVPGDRRATPSSTEKEGQGRRDAGRSQVVHGRTRDLSASVPVGHRTPMRMA